ncbi:saccharopine dehydrogenase family protein [Paraburkholderia sediminicola]|uniref:hypothetical protein n=1 Tax=Paraburkholderia sediminicola TaxID=458836 RepID=UPI0038BB8D07
MEFDLGRRRIDRIDRAAHEAILSSRLRACAPVPEAGIVVAVINCAGPFASTSAPVIEAALRARIPYLDVAAELEANLDTFKHYAERAREAGVVIVPGMAFFGGLGDLLATAAMGDWTAADEICIAYGLSSWKPTLGTRAAGQVSRQRREGRRLVFTKGQMAFRTDAAPVAEWQFPAPLGKQPVIGEFTMADTVMIARPSEDTRDTLVHDCCGG